MVFVHGCPLAGTRHGLEDFRTAVAGDQQAPIGWQQIQNLATQLSRVGLAGISAAGADVRARIGFHIADHARVEEPVQSLLVADDKLNSSSVRATSSTFQSRPTAPMSCSPNGSGGRLPNPASFHRSPNSTGCTRTFNLAGGSSPAALGPRWQRCGPCTVGRAPRAYPLTTRGNVC